MTEPDLDPTVRQAAAPTVDDPAASNPPVPDMSLGADVAEGDQDLVWEPGVVHPPFKPGGPGDGRGSRD